MNNSIVKVLLKQVKPKTFVLLQNFFTCSAEDSSNLILDLEEVKAKLPNLRNKERINLFKEIDKTNVEYFWFFI